MIDHMVLIKRKQGATDAQMLSIFSFFATLQGQIDGIVASSAGTNFSERSGGFTDALYARFRDRAALDEYAPHPLHQELVRRLNEVSEPRVIVDYEI